MRARASVAVMLSLTACSIFGGENDSKEEPEVSDAATDAPITTEDASRAETATDSGGTDSSDGAVKPAPLLCGAATCVAGEKCCITDLGRKCETLCGGFDFDCFSASQCAVGTVCCFSSNASRCRTSCTSRTVCELDSECGTTGTCKAATCNPPALSFKSCAKGGTTFVDLPQNGSCSLP